MKYRVGKSVIVFISAVLLTSVFVGCFGVLRSLSADSGSHMASNCALMPGASMPCEMTPLEHIAAWQNMFFTALPHQGNHALYLSALFGLVFGTFSLQRYRILLPRVLHLHLQFLYHKRGRRMPIMPTLQEAFSSGILHSKVF